MERFTRPGSQGPQSAGQPAQQTAKPFSGDNKAKSKAFGMPSTSSKILVVALIVVALALAVALSYGVYKSFKGTKMVETDKFQAVFLQNGQVYFGHLSNVNKDYVKLTDIYYLQVQQQVQPDQKTSANSTSNQQTQVSLAKLGNELHGPEDTMYITRAQVVFWENLKNDGQVVQAIDKYVSGQNNNSSSSNTNSSSNNQSSSNSSSSSSSSSNTNSSN